MLIGTKGLPLEDELIEPPPITSAKITDGLSHTICVTECTGRGVSIKDGKIDALHGAWASGNNVSHIDGGVNDSKTRQGVVRGADSLRSSGRCEYAEVRWLGAIF